MLIQCIQNKLRCKTPASNLIGCTFTTKYILKDFIYDKTTDNKIDCIETINLKWKILGINMYQPVYNRYINDQNEQIYRKDRIFYKRRWNNEMFKYEYFAIEPDLTDFYPSNNTATAQVEYVLITSDDGISYAIDGCFSEYSSDYLMSDARRWLNSFKPADFFTSNRMKYKSNGFLLKHRMDLDFLQAICPVFIDHTAISYDYVSLPALSDFNYGLNDVKKVIDPKLSKKIQCQDFNLNHRMCWMMRDSIGDKIVSVREDGYLELNSLDDFDQIAPICTIQ